jgi:PAS domain-containing protein
MPEKPEKCEDHVGEEARDQKTADTPVMSDEVIRVMTGHFSANLIIDPLDGRILAANPPARELLSLEAEDLPTVADLSEKGFPPPGLVRPIPGYPARGTAFYLSRNIRRDPATPTQRGAYGLRGPGYFHRSA